MSGIRTKQEKVLVVIAHVVMIFLTICAIAPFWLLVSSSLQTQQSILQNGYQFIPNPISFDAYAYILKEIGQVARAYGITILVTVLGTALSLIITSMTAYVLTIKGLPGAGIIFAFILITMLLNGGTVATYITYTKVVDVRDSIFALLIPNLLMNGFSVMLVRNYYKNSIPYELIEAAQIDGAGFFRTYVQIIFPLSKPILATVGVMTALGYWNDWTNGLYFIKDSKYYSIQLLLNQINNSASYLASHSELKIPASEIPSIGVRLAISVLVILPIAIVYPFFQKYFVAGVTNGAVKG